MVYTDLADLALDEKLKRIGLRPVHIPCSRLNEIPEAIIRMGQLLHREDAANTLASGLRAEIAQCQATPPPPRRPRVLVLIWNDPLMAAGRNTFISDLVTLAGGQNVGDEIDRDYFQVSGEWVLARDPEVIFCFFMASGNPVREAVMQYPGWHRLQAVKQGHVHDGFDNNLVVRPGPRVMQGLERIRPCIAAATGGTPP